jgi:hypothetical protein
MIRLRVLLGASAALILAAGSASAQCTSPFCGPGHSSPGTEGPFSFLFNKRPVPAFQAAPWYLYWPYQAHFMTAAPLPGQTYGAPGYGPMVNPYFPAVPAAVPAPAGN